VGQVGYLQGIYSYPYALSAKHKEEQRTTFWAINVPVHGYQQEQLHTYLITEDWCSYP